MTLKVQELQSQSSKLKIYGFISKMPKNCERKLLKYFETVFPCSINGKINSG